METTRAEIEGLMSLFNTAPRRRYENSDDDDDDDVEKNNEQAPELDPTVNATGENENRKNPYAKLDPKEEKERNYEDVAAENDFFFNEEKPSTDWKKTPKWQLSYRQQVTSSDVFLQMGPKNPSTACCENMIIEIWLPSDKRQNIDLKVMNTQLKVFSPNHVLDIPLPHPVDPQKGKAEWDNDNEKLIITLEMIREFDFVNF